MSTLCRDVGHSVGDVIIGYHHLQWSLSPALLILRAPLWIISSPTLDHGNDVIQIISSQILPDSSMKSLFPFAVSPKGYIGTPLCPSGSASSPFSSPHTFPPTASLFGVDVHLGKELFQEGSEVEDKHHILPSASGVLMSINELGAKI